MFEYRAQLIKVVDGDTVDVSVDLGFRLHQDMRLRLLGINTPELLSKSETERLAAQAARDYLRGLLEGKSLRIQTHKDGQDKYGRYLAVIFVDDLNVNQDLIKAGHGVPYMV